MHFTQFINTDKNQIISLNVTFDFHVAQWQQKVVG